MKAERCVVDTNVLISALLQPSGRTAEVVEAIRAGGTLVLSDETFAELASRLMRSKFDRYVDRALRQRFLSDLASVAEWVTVTGGVAASRDPDDDKFLETAINGEADCIVTGDADPADARPVQWRADPDATGLPRGGAGRRPRLSWLLSTSREFRGRLEQHQRRCGVQSRRS